MSHLRYPLLAVLLAFACSIPAGAQQGFEQYTTYPLDQEAKTVVVGDLNGDGRDDAAVAAWPSALYVLYQQPDGVLGPPVSLFAPNMPFGLALGDLNGDGRTDIAVGGTGDYVLVYYQRPDGALGLPGVCGAGGFVAGIAVGDISGDGRADMVVAVPWYSAILVSLQLPDGNLDMPLIYRAGGANARCVCTPDLNSDGRRDLAFLTDDHICYMLQTSEGALGAMECLPALWAHSMAAGDVTGDGRDDLVYTVAANTPDAAVGVYPQTEAGELGQLITYPAYDYAQPLALADVDGDGKSDVVTAHGGYEALSVFLQGSDGRLGAYATYPFPYCNGYQPGGIAAGDLNSDGKTDIAVADWYNGLVVLPGAASAVDTTAPTCSVALSGTQGLNGWFTSPVTVTVTAEDEAGGSGLAGVFFSSDGVDWRTYSGPVELATPGVYHLGCYAEDLAANRSDTQWADAKLDPTAPTIAVEPQVEALWPPNGAVVPVSVSVSAVDDVSGLASLHLSVVDEYGLVQPEMDVQPGVVSVPLVALRNDGDQDGRVYTLVLTGTDAAGNTAVTSAKVIVPKSKPGKTKPVKPGK